VVKRYLFFEAGIKKPYGNRDVHFVPKRAVLACDEILTFYFYPQIRLRPTRSGRCFQVDTEYFSPRYKFLRSDDMFGVDYLLSITAILKSIASVAGYINASAAQAVCFALDVTYTSTEQSADNFCFAPLTAFRDRG